MSENEEIKQIKDIVNETIKSFVYTPWCVYTKFTTKDETDIIACINNNEVIKLKARTYQDNHYNELVERARLDIDIFTSGEEKGEHLYMESQYDSMSILLELEKGIEIKPPYEYLFIEKAISSFYEIAEYYKKIKALEKESADISPGSPRCELEHEFYNTEWEI